MFFYPVYRVCPMLLNHLTYRKNVSQLIYRTNIRLASAIAGQHGRVYVQGEVLSRREDEKLNIFKAEYVLTLSYDPWHKRHIRAILLIHSHRSENESFVFKRVSKPFYELSQRLAAEFAGTRRLRMHTDCNQEQGILVYPYFRGTLLRLIQKDPELPFPERKKILRHVGEAIHELHSKD